MSDGDRWVLVGVNTDLPTEPDSVKAFGPFAQADDARELANLINVGGPIVWTVVPLIAG